jgi:hypothetical protein
MDCTRGICPFAGIASVANGIMLRSATASEGKPLYVAAFSQGDSGCCPPFGTSRGHAQQLKQKGPAGGIYLRIGGARCCVEGQHQLRLFDLNGEATGQDKENQRDHLANLADSIIR